jgi:hypothetical protein
MSHLFKHKPSPALVVATLALLFALTGTGIAAVAALPRNSVGTRQLRNGAVVSSKVRNHSLLARDFKRGQLPRGPVGPVGPAGPAGPQGPAGPAGPSGNLAVSVHEADAAVGPGRRAFAIAACASGQRAVGGGVYLADSTPDNQDAIMRNAPVNSTGGTAYKLLASGQAPNAWYGQAYNAGTNGATVHVYVICTS